MKRDTKSAGKECDIKCCVCKKRTAIRVNFPTTFHPTRQPFLIFLVQDFRYSLWLAYVTPSHFNSVVYFTTGP
jgi:hypothetical protein